MPGDCLCRFTGKTKRVIVIRNMADLNRVTISDITKADIVVSCPTLFHSDKYCGYVAEGII